MVLINPHLAKVMQASLVFMFCVHIDLTPWWTLGLQWVVWKKNRKGSITWCFQCLENSIGIGFDWCSTSYFQIIICVCKIFLNLCEGWSRTLNKPYSKHVWFVWGVNITTHKNWNYQTSWSGSIWKTKTEVCIIWAIPSWIGRYEDDRSL
jgi:hypothetical protein